MINVDEYIKNNVSLENYDDEIKNLMIKIEHEQEKIYNKKEVKTLNLNDFKEYNRSISEMYMKIRGSEKYESYKLFFEEHSANAYINKTLIGMTSSDINTLKELMDPHTKNFILYEGYSVASNPNATPEMLRELSKHFDNTAELIENPNTPIDVLEKYKKIFDNEEYSTGDKEIYERANERLKDSF